ncbi:hypothetical protein F0562_004003 [Nyssa sinensis]|uniref:Uncharacterized protein n=1 Tax=Nyssa sinensis TaxID=561372 RepID=A0A5J5BY42_9ASTE|nr:hypothetical protein F0562_004003 [Nyssa sinensis]
MTSFDSVAKTPKPRLLRLSSLVSIVDSFRSLFLRWKLGAFFGSVLVFLPTKTFGKTKDSTELSQLICAKASPNCFIYFLGNQKFENYHKDSDIASVLGFHFLFVSLNI